MLKYRTYHAGNHGDLKSKDSNNTTVMRIPMTIIHMVFSQWVDPVHHFSKYVPMNLT